MRYTEGMRRILLIAVLAGFAANAAADPESDVRCREIGFSKAAERRDVGAFVAFVDDDARFVGRTVMRGPRDILEAWSRFFEDDGPTIKWRPRFVEVLEDGKLALTRGPYRLIDRDADGAKVERWGTFNSVWRKQDDETWRVVFDAGSPGNDEPDDETRAILEAEDDC